MAASVGLKIMTQLMDDDVANLAGPKGKHDPTRSAVRHGYEKGSVVLGGRRVPVDRPRVRAADGSGELPIASYEAFNHSDVLTRAIMARMLTGVATRDYHRTLEAVGAVGEKSVSKSSASRRLIQATQAELDRLMNQSLTDLVLPVIMIDGIRFGGYLLVAALGIDTTGVKHPLAVVEGSSENTTLVSLLLTGLRDRGLDTKRATLFVIDGGKALAAGIRKVFDKPVIQRCQVHKLRNVTDLLPDRIKPVVASRIQTAWGLTDTKQAERTLRGIAAELETAHPSAAKSLREGLTETLTLIDLNTDPLLARSLKSTNAIESMNSMARGMCGNVKHWQSGTMALRWMAAAMTECQTHWRRIKGYQALPALITALEQRFEHTTGKSSPHVTDGDYAPIQEPRPETSPAT
jgi:transposase-like protein